MTLHAIRTWWGERFIAALEAFTDSGRLARGRSYANSDRVKRWRLEKGGVNAEILGRANPYYGVYTEPTYITRVALKPISAGDWTLLIRALGSRAAFAARLLLNEVPETIEKPFECLDLHLLPHRARDLETRCSCPDYSSPCKHVAGLCYVIAAELDRDPFLLFELRGLPREALFRELRETPLGQALVQHLEAPGEGTVAMVESYFTPPKPASTHDTSDPGAFWQARRRLPDTLDRIAPAVIPALLVKKGGAFPEFWDRDTPFPEVMEAVYEAIRKRARDW